MKLYSVGYGGLFAVSVLAMDVNFDCKDIAAAGLIDAIVAGAAGSFEDGTVLATTTDQIAADGLSCWDLNGNGVGDLDSEDTNADGVVDVQDCRAGSAGGGQRRVLAQAVVRADGTLESGFAIMSVARTALGAYTVVVDVTSVRLAGSTIAADVPVFITVNAGALASGVPTAYYQNVTLTETALTISVQIIGTVAAVQTPVDAEFSIQAFRPRNTAN